MATLIKVENDAEDEDDGAGTPTSTTLLERRALAGHATLEDVVEAAAAIANTASLGQDQV